MVTAGISSPVTASTVAMLLLIQAAGAPDADGFTAAGFTFLATLMALALLEHWLLVLPLPAAALWSWYLSARESGVTLPSAIPTQISTNRRQ